ncbi:MAG: DUF1800 domain-containing protein [Halieaceae bacterium]|nr:DUF1800 domain-containing protein [Halieaceae bacterium]
MIRNKSLAFIFSIVLTACGGGGGGGSSVTVPVAQAPVDNTPALSLNEAARIADQTTFGPRMSEIEQISKEGLDAWLAQQYQASVGLHEPIVRRYLSEYGYDVNATPNPGFYRRYAFWEQAFTAPDPMRQVVAYALTQLFVVSEPTQIFVNPLALSNYYDTLLTHAFGNFEDLLLAVTLHPAMGFYLSHVNNAKTDPVANTFPDENYAREVMQLFTIGLYELNPDGTRKTDSEGRSIPTYNNATIREFSKVFTGLSYGSTDYSPNTFFGKTNPAFNTPMLMFETYHEPGAKTLLNGYSIPAGQTGMQDIHDAVKNLFNHPNVGPFVGKQLIQRLVTSNPSPAYVARVTAAFNGDTSGVRGDMRAVINAIFTDQEAATGVRVREPFRRYLALNRSLNAAPEEGQNYMGLGGVVQNLTGQFVLAPPSVFNFYSPFYRPAGPAAQAGLSSPELQITTEDTVVGVTNLMAYALSTGQSIDTYEGYPKINIDLSDYAALANDQEALLDRLELEFFQGQLSTGTRGIIRDTLSEAAGASDQDIAKLALYLAVISPEQAVTGGEQ